MHTKVSTWFAPEMPAVNELTKAASHLHLDDGPDDGHGIAIDCTLSTHEVAMSGEI